MCSLKKVLLEQLRVTWALAELTLEDLTEEECLWISHERCWTVRRGPGGEWEADWAEPEPESAPPPSLGWMLWHTIWWWSTLIDRSFGDGELRREDVRWPGASPSFIALKALHNRWSGLLEDLDDDDLEDNRLSRWPHTDGRPFGQIVGWANIELMKNVAEMASARQRTPQAQARLSDADGRSS